jgi:hypothetical protein
VRRALSPVGLRTSRNDEIQPRNVAHKAPKDRYATTRQEVPQALAICPLQCLCRLSSSRFSGVVAEFPHWMILGEGANVCASSRFATVGPIARRSSSV